MTTTSQRIRLGVCLFGTALAVAAGALRDASADETDPKARAQTLFLEGRTAIDKGDHATGCPKVRESLALFTVANSLFTVAQCDEHDGKTASALEHWQRGLALVDAGDLREKVAKERIAELEPRVPRIRVVIPPASVSAVIVFDDVELTPAALTTPLRINPGKHVFIVRAAGRQDMRREIDIAEKERTEFVATLGALVSGKPAPTASASSTPPPPPPPPPSNPRRTAGFVVGGVGVVGLLASGLTAIRVSSVKDDLDLCKNTTGCKVTDDGKVDQYKTMLVTNAVATGIGVLGLGTGLFLILTAPKKSDAKPANTSLVPIVMPGGAGISLSGRF